MNCFRPLFAGCLCLLALTEPALAQPAAPAPQAGVTAAPNAGAGAQPAAPLVLSGTPFLSPTHRQVADQVRAGQHLQTPPYSEDATGLPAGTIGVLLRGPDHRPMAGVAVKLAVTHQSIAEGDDTKSFEQITDPEGRAGFLQQNTDTAYRYEVTTEYQGGKYSSGPFQLRRDAGRVVALTLYPSSPDINQAFVFTRALYVVVPRDDVFDMQVLLRIHNEAPVTWLARDLSLQLPEGAKGFKPGETTGDVKLRFEGGRVLVDGTIHPGQREFSFNFQVPNDRYASATFRLPIPPHLIDARVYAEGSPDSVLNVSGFDSAQETKGKDGQRALLASKDYLRTDGSPDSIEAVLSGLPTRGYAPWLAAGIAAVLALLGVAFAAKGDTRQHVTSTDRQKARQVLFDELLLLERARQTDQIGPKTYEHTRRTLLDAIARLDSADANA